MNWQTKARLLRILARLPAPVASALTYRLQRRFGALRTLEPWEHFGNAAEMMAAARQAGALPVAPRVLEIGTGAQLALALAFWLLGGAHVATVDRRRGVRLALVEEDLRALRGDPALARALLWPQGGDSFPERLDRVLAADLSARDLMARLDYRAPVDGRRMPFDEASFDLVVSRSVLEHIPAGEIPALLEESRRVTAPGGLAVHLIDFSDHFAHQDTSIPLVNFLRFSGDEWHALAGNRLAFHNRLRSADWEELFGSCGHDVLVASHIVDEASRHLIDDGFPVHESFRHHAGEVLACRRALYVLSAT